MNIIKDVFFDLDHTLWDFDKNSEQTFDTIFKKNNLNISLEKFIEAYIPNNQACWKLFQFDKITHDELRYKRLKMSFDALQHSITDAEINKISDQYIEILTEYNHLFDGTFEILDYLKSKYNLHIITNGFEKVQFKKLINSKLNNYFKTVTNSEMAGVKKPNLLIFNYALAKANAKKESSIMIGDSIEADVQGALAAGMQAIYFNEHKQKSPNNIIQINHLVELKKYL